MNTIRDAVIATRDRDKCPYCNVEGKDFSSADIRSDLLCAALAAGINN